MQIAMREARDCTARNKRCSARNMFPSPKSLHCNRKIAAQEIWKTSYHFCLVKLTSGKQVALQQKKIAVQQKNIAVQQTNVAVQSPGGYVFHEVYLSTKPAP